jgi:hypothetical protein
VRRDWFETAGCSQAAGVILRFSPASIFSVTAPFPTKSLWPDELLGMFADAGSLRSRLDAYLQLLLTWNQRIN